MNSWQQKETAKPRSQKEVGYIRKPHTDRLRVALAFPNTYYVGMSNLGFQTVYQLFNAHDDTVCERIFLPPKQQLKEQLASKTPLITLESQSLARDFDVIAFSVSFEWDYTNILTMLRLAGVPVRAADRTARDPLVVIGGAVTFVNPEPLALFADVIAAGEGEQLVPELIASYREEGGRRDLLKSLAGKRGFYIPSFYDVEYQNDGTIARWIPKEDTGAPAAVKKAALPTTEAVDPPCTGIFTPDTEFGSRFLVEVVRGCANLCRFCWAGYNYLPVRAFPADRILQRAREARAHARQAGLVSIALCDHPEIDRILTGLAEMGYSISPASLRLDDLTETIVRQLRASGEKTLTIAPETGSDRLRRVINKTVTNDEILDRAELIFASGIENLKLYYMIGLPTETDEDLVAIRDLTLQLREIMMKHAMGKGQVGRIIGSVNPLVPKPSTAYQWLPMEDPVDCRTEGSAAARADLRHRQRVLQHQVRASFVLPGSAVARRPPCRAGYRSGRSQRRRLAPGSGRRRRRRRLLRVPRSFQRRRAAVEHHRRRYERDVLPQRARQELPRGMDAATEARCGEREAAPCVVTRSPADTQSG